MLGGRVAVAHLLGGFDRAVDDALRTLARLANLRSLDLGLVFDVFRNRRIDCRRVCPDALDDGGEISLVGIEKGLQQMLGLDGGSLRIGSDRDRILQSLRGRDCQFIDSHVAPSFRYSVVVSFV